MKYEMTNVHYFAFKRNTKGSQLFAHCQIVYQSLTKSRDEIQIQLNAKNDGIK